VAPSVAAALAATKNPLLDFGTRRAASRKTRRGVNPRTRETIQIPAKRTPKFVPGKGFEEKLRDQ